MLDSWKSVDGCRRVDGLKRHRIDAPPLNEYTCAMTVAVEKIVSEVLGLPPALRAFVAETLIESLDAGSGGELSPEWQKEIHRRCKEIDQGMVELRDAESVFARAFAALA